MMNTCNELPEEKILDDEKRDIAHKKTECEQKVENDRLQYQGQFNDSVVTVKIIKKTYTSPAYNRSRNLSIFRLSSVLCRSCSA